MKTRVISVLLAALLLACLAGCGQVQDAIEDLGGGGTSGGKIGDWNKTYFFDFKVVSAQKVDTFGGYVPEEGNALLDIVIETKNTFGSEFVMIDTDYEVWWGSDDNDDALAYTLLEVEGAVEEYVDLPAGASMTEHYIYEVPENETEFKLLYLEIFDTDNEDERYGDAHFVHFTV